jgi:hypothetical protein
MTDGENTRAIKATLRKAFSGTGFSVTRGGSYIKWTDDGPTVEQVEDALIGAGAEAKPGWNGERRLHLHGRSFWFDRYNAGERAAEQESLARRRQEWQAQQQRENDAVCAAVLAKRNTVSAPACTRRAASAEDPEAHAAFEALRQRAETDVDCDVERKVRPSWAPPLIIEGELLEICIALGWLEEDDKPIARLWASFADPKAAGSILRERRSRHTLSGIACRGFQLHAGSERGSTGSMLFEAQRTETGQWRFGPYVSTSDYYSPRSSEWERLIRERERCQSIPGLDARIERISEQLAAIDAQDLANAQEHHKRQAAPVRAVELAKARVLDFAGAPGVQMALAGRLSGMCFNCGRALTDPLSLERGIGPECLDNKVHWIRRMGAEMDVPTLAFLSGMPKEFVVEVIAVGASQTFHFGLNQEPGGQNHE